MNEKTNKAEEKPSQPPKKETSKKKAEQNTASVKAEIKQKPKGTTKPEKSAEEKQKVFDRVLNDIKKGTANTANKDKAEPEKSAGEEEDAKMIELQDKCKSLEQEKDKLVRYAAELDNVARRAKKEVEDTRKFGISSFAKDTIDVVDNLYRALESVKEDEIEKGSMLDNIYIGVKMTLDSMINVMEKHGMERVDPINQEIFDHNEHQAMSQMINDEVPENTILNVMQAGYKLNGRLLKPASVIISKKNDTGA